MGEVNHKKKKIEDHPAQAENYLRKDPIKVVRGPNGDLFITDHHHGALALMEAGYESGVCSIEHHKLSTDPARFWDELAEKKLDHLEDKDGIPIPPEKLPKTLEELQSQDDPYRTLAWLVRKENGFCRDPKNIEFAEFGWADWMRKRTELPPDEVARSPDEALTEALKLVRSPAAKEAKLPGYNPCKKDGEECPICSDGEDK